MRLVSKYNEGIRFLFTVDDIFSKYVRAVSLKDKKGNTITKPCQKFLDEFNHKPKKILVDKGSEFCNRSMKFWL